MWDPPSNWIYGNIRWCDVRVLVSDNFIQKGGFTSVRNELSHVGFKKLPERFHMCVVDFVCFEMCTVVSSVFPVSNLVSKILSYDENWCWRPHLRKVENLCVPSVLVTKFVHIGLSLGRVHTGWTVCL